jgi:hypothetical protein
MDLSKLLGDLYETNEADAPVDAPFANNSPASPASPVSPPAPGPEWADEALLDEAFASWKPGPPDDAPAAEREMANGFPGTSFPQLDGAFGSDDHLDGSMLTRDLAMFEGGTPPSVETDVEAADPIEPGPPRMWTRADDDVLPNRRGGRRALKLSLRRR